MKNLIKVILASMLCFTLCGCQNEASNSHKAIKCYIDNIYIEANVKNVIVENL